MIKKNNLTKKQDLLNEFWVSWTQIINWFIEEDYRSDLQWREWCRIYDEMRKSDAQINATLQAMELPIRQTKWYIEAVWNKEWKIDIRSQEIADFVWKNLFEQMDNTFDDLIRQILTMLPFWYSVFEKVYKIEDWKILIKKLWYRKQTTIFKWQMDNWQPGIVQLSQDEDDKTEMSIKNSNIQIPKDKIIIFTYRQEWLNYEWMSVLRSAYKHWYIKDKLYRFDAVKQERQSVWIPVIYLPRSASDIDKNEAQRIVKNIRSTEQTWIVMPWPKEDWWLFEFADTKANTNTNLFESIKHHNREISKNILAQFLELWDTESWSRSLWADQSDLFLLSLWAIANYIKDKFNKEIIPELIDMNFDIWNNYYPQLKFVKLWKIDYKWIVDNLATLATSWILQVDDGLDTYIRETLDLPAKIENKKDEVEDDNEMKKEEKNKEKENNDLEDEIKAYEWCNHNHEEDQIFSNKYFQELSNLIDKKFIIDLHKDEV